MSKPGAVLLLLLVGGGGTALAQANLGPITVSRENRVFFAGSTLYPTIQSAVTAACALTNAQVVIPYGVSPSDTIAAASGCSTVTLDDKRSIFDAWYATTGTAYTQSYPPGLTVSGPATIGGYLNVNGNLTMTNQTAQFVLGNTLLAGTGNTTLCDLCTYYNAGSNAYFGQGQTYSQVTVVSYDGNTATDSWGLYLGKLPASNSTPGNSDYMLNSSAFSMGQGKFFGWSASSTGAGAAQSALSLRAGFSNPSAGSVSCDTTTAGNANCAFSAGSVTLKADPTAALQASTKQYVDARTVPGVTDNGTTTTFPHAGYFSGTADKTLTAGTAGTNGYFDVDPGDACTGVYSADFGHYLGFCASNNPPASWAAAILQGSGFHFHGVAGGGGSDPIFGVSSNGQYAGGIGLGHIAFTVENSNQVYTYNNTLDDGQGNAALKSVSSPSYVSPVVTLTGATPAINVAAGQYQTITLAANATPTVTGLAGGQRLVFEICQPASGGPYTWTWPAAFHGGAVIGTAAGTCTVQAFAGFSSGSMLAESPGLTGLAP